MKSLFIFRRDFRLHDNIGLINALKNSDIVIPIFIYTPEQLINNKFKSDNAVQFMIESLNDLDMFLRKKGSKLLYFYGNPANVISELIKDPKLDIGSVYVNMDYTPYSTKRDQEIKKICLKNELEFHSYEDILLNPVRSILTGSDSVYLKFTPYYNKAKKIKIKKPLKNNYKNFFKGKIKNQYSGNINKFYKYNDNIAVNGGRTEALKIFKNLKDFKTYDDTRNDLSKETTRLSAYIKFGCVSIREVYEKFRKVNMDLVRQIYWRDFYYNILYEYPELLGNPLKEKYGEIKWLGNVNFYNRWKNGKTGYPIVDAGMRELNETGFMHNRSRLITSNFLIKILLVDWRKGEKYYASKLVDYDPAVNNGNWQWSSGSGADSQPYFRIFNPWLQSKKYDTNCEYIKKWIPELREVENKYIHEWDKYWDKHNNVYIKPMVDYKKYKDRALKAYKMVLK